MSTIALMGAGGKMGNRIARNLKDHPDYTTLYVEVSEAGRASLAELGVSVTPQDEAMKQADVVILAVPDALIGKICSDIVPKLKSGTMVMGLDPAAGYAVNLTGTYNILEAARLLDVGKVIFSSTAAVWGSDLPDPIPNDQVQRPVTMYGTSKVCCERLGEYYSRRYNLDFRGVRFICIMGPGRVAGVGWTAYTSLVIEETARGNPFTLKVNKDLRLYFLYLKDAAYALYDIKNADRTKLTRCIYNVDGYPATTEQIVTTIMKHNPTAQVNYDFDPEYQHIMDTQYALLAKRTDDSMAREDWGWAPHYSLDTAVADFVQDVRTGALLLT